MDPVQNPNIEVAAGSSLGRFSGSHVFVALILLRVVYIFNDFMFKSLI
jgi:hypothetical protein